MSIDKEEAALQRSMWDWRVYVVGGGFEYIAMFYKAGFKGATCVADANLVVFTGGEDVDPSLYDEKPIDGVYFNKLRDAREAAIYKEAQEFSRPCVGICRGAQFLNVMNGGRLWQHVNNHGVHLGHPVIDMVSGEIIDKVTSTHHQQMIPDEDAEIIAVAERSTIKQSEFNFIQRDEPENDDIEVVFYPKTSSLCFQPHPEIGCDSTEDYFLSVLDRYIIPAL